MRRHHPRHGRRTRILIVARFSSRSSRYTGGERAAAIYSVIETAKMNGLEPQAYIADVMARIPADWPSSRWDELMPWNWSPPQPVPVAQAT
jgi:hypothetical protein